MKYSEWLNIWLENYVKPTHKIRTFDLYRQMVKMCLRHIQARRFAARSSTRQTNSLNSDKKVNSKPSETGRSPLNRLANRPVILRTAAYFEFYSFSIFRVFSLRYVSGGVFTRRPFFMLQNSFFSPFRV